MSEMPIWSNDKLSSTLARLKKTNTELKLTSYKERIFKLKQLKKSIIKNKSDLAIAANRDFGHRSEYETLILEVAPIIQGLNYIIKHLKSWMKPELRKVEIQLQRGRAFVLYQPKGVIGIISPWNYPISLSIMPLATAIAAGNRVMVKPSESTPATNVILNSIINEVFDRDEVVWVDGDIQVASSFSKLAFDHILFTGSTEVGKIILKSASENLVPTTLELGGKSPVVIEKGYDLKRAASSIVFGKLSNGGQACIAPDYLFIHKSDLDTLLKELVDAAKKQFPLKRDVDFLTTIISEAHLKRINDLVNDAVSKGGKVIEIYDEKEFKLNNKFCLPRFIVNVNDEMKIMQNEIFGPILPIVTYEDFSEVIRYINEHPRPLALYYFGNSELDKKNILFHTTSGNVSINTTMYHFAVEDLPFGGIGFSGMGAYHGKEGFITMSHVKGIFELSRWNLTSLLYSPHSKMTDLILKYLIR